MDINVLSKILEWQFLLQIVVTECKIKQYFVQTPQSNPIFE